MSAVLGGHRPPPQFESGHYHANEQLDPSSSGDIFWVSKLKSMAASSPTLLVAATDQVALVKISGRANFTCSVDFKALVYGLRDRGHRRYVLDLTDCLIVDSTFLGVLAGFALKLIESSDGRATIT